MNYTEIEAEVSNFMQQTASNIEDAQCDIDNATTDIEDAVGTIRSALEDIDRERQELECWTLDLLEASEEDQETIESIKAEVKKWKGLYGELWMKLRAIYEFAEDNWKENNGEE